MAINQIGVIESLQGQVSVIHADGTTGLLQNGSKVYTGDTLVTADDGAAEIRFIDGTLHALGPEITAILNADVLDPGKGGSPFQPLSGDSDAVADVMLNHAGVVTALNGDVEIMHADGRSEALQVGDVLTSGDVIITASNGSADLALPDGSGRHIGPDLKFSPGGETSGFGSASPSALTAARAEAADIMQAILEGEDPAESADVPAAGEEAQGDSGTSFVRLEENGRRVTPESGHETSGISYGFTEIQDDLLQSPVNRAPELHNDNTTGAGDDILSTKENTPIAIDAAYLLANDTDPDGDTLTLVSVGRPAHGSVELLGDQVVFTPDPGFFGIASFQYTVSDGAMTATASVTVHVDSVPDAGDDQAVVDESAMSPVVSSGPQTVSVDFGDEGPGEVNGNGSFLSSTVLTSAGQAVEVAVDADGNYSGTVDGGNTTVFTLVFDPSGSGYSFTLERPLDHPDSADPDDVLSLDFGYTATDINGDTVSGAVRILVNDDGPSVTEAGMNTAEDSAISFNVFDYASAGADGAVLKGVSLAVAGDGVITAFDATGNITYTPAPGFEGVAIVNYTIEDGDGDQAGGQVSIDVGQDSQPEVLDSSATVDESALAGGSGGGSDTASGSLSIATGGDTLAGLSVNGEAVAAEGMTLIAGEYGELSIDIDGNWTYTLYASPVAHPLAGASGAADVVQESFAILVTDSDGDEAGATLRIDVTDDGPVAVADGTVAVDEGASVVGNLLANDMPGADGATLTHVNGSELVFDAQSGEATVVTSLGALVVQADGSYRYTANDNSNGTDTFSYTLTDADGDGSQATISFALQDANEPVAGDLARTVDEAGLATGSDPGSDGEITSGNLADLGVNFHGDNPGSLSVGLQSIVLDGGGTDSITVNGSYGSWQIHDDGSWTYTLTQGTDTHSTQGTATDGVSDVFSYIATDSDGDQAGGTLTVSVQDDVATAIADPDTVALRDGEVSPNATLASLIAVAGADGASVTAVNGMELAGSGVLVIDGENGSLQVDLDSGTFSYHANEEDTGNDSFEFTVTDGDGDTDTVTVSYDVNDRPNFAAETYVWMPVDPAQQSPGYESGYPIGLEVSDLDSTLTVVITEVPDDGQAGYYDDSNSFIPLAVGDAFVLEAGEVMPQIVYIPPDVDLEAVVDPITDVVTFTVTEDGDPLSTQSGTININAMPPHDLPGQEALIGDGNTPLTSGNDQAGELLVNANLVTAITRDIGDDGVINTSFIELYTDFQERPSSGGVPIPDTHRADAELETTVSASVVIDGITFTVISENDAVNQWAYDSDSGLMKAVVDYNDILSADTAVFDGSLADYLAANPPEAGDNWTVIYQDSGSGNEQARFLKFDFAYENPGDPAINAVGGVDAPNIIYGSTGDDLLTGSSSQDEIVGRDGNDVLVGGGGDDLFVGGGGEDTMTGGAGGDRFVFNAADEGVDTVTDYSNNESDVLDISDILTGFDPENDNLSDFVSITSDGTDATLAVDPGGGGAYTDVALLTNITAGTIVTVQVSEDTTETLIVA